MQLLVALVLKYAQKPTILNHYYLYTQSGVHLVWFIIAANPTTPNPHAMQRTATCNQRDPSNI